MFKRLIYIILFLVFNSKAFCVNETPELVSYRVYGENEKLPPVLFMDGESVNGTSVGSGVINVELDFKAKSTPSLYAVFVHCNADWTEDQNVFFQDFTLNRYSVFQWTTATYSDGRHSHRGKMTFPGTNVKFKYSGNWLAKFYQYYGDTACVASVKFFVVDGALKTWGEYYTGFYDSKCNVTNTCLNFDVYASSSKPLWDNKVIGAVLYRNFRWNEPFAASDKQELHKNDKYYGFKYKYETFGTLQTQMQFKLEKIPAENKYRTYDFTNLANFPRTSYPVALPMSDLRRDGMFSYYDDDGALITDWVANHSDDYVNVKFVLDPESSPQNKDVFLIGSFNNWTPDKNWQLTYDETQRLYTLDAFVRRGRHNYLYAVGTFDHVEQKVYNFATDCLEGNTPYSNHSYYAFIYYRDPAFGGYDAIIGACMIER